MKLGIAQTIEQKRAMRIFRHFMWENPTATAVEMPDCHYEALSQICGSYQEPLMIDGINVFLRPDAASDFNIARR